MENGLDHLPARYVMSGLMYLVFGRNSNSNEESSISTAHEKWGGAGRSIKCASEFGQACIWSHAPAIKL